MRHSLEMVIYNENVVDVNVPFLTISRTALLANMHPQTIRQYDRLNLVVPQRTPKGGRRYSLRDVKKLLEIQALSQVEKINLSGIKRILALEEELYVLKQHIKAKKENSLFTVAKDGEIILETILY
jgi:MerR family transcriptional regulator/heat shock protein HspR